MPKASVAHPSQYSIQKASYTNNIPVGNELGYNSANAPSNLAQGPIEVSPSENFSNGQAAGQKILEVTNEVNMLI